MLRFRKRKVSGNLLSNVLPFFLITMSVFDVLLKFNYKSFFFQLGTQSELPELNHILFSALNISCMQRYWNQPYCSYFFLKKTFKSVLSILSFGYIAYIASCISRQIFKFPPPPADWYHNRFYCQVCWGVRLLMPELEPLGICFEDMGVLLTSVPPPSLPSVPAPSPVGFCKASALQI